MQGDIEGGFRGRTNKLVDGCYSFWQGSLFPLLHSLQSDLSNTARRPAAPAESAGPAAAEEGLSLAALELQIPGLVARARRAADAAQVTFACQHSCRRSAVQSMHIMPGLQCLAGLLAVQLLADGRQ